MYLMQTVSSAPVARLRDQDRNNSALVADIESMESRETSGAGVVGYNNNKSDGHWANGSYEDKSAKKSKKWSIGKLFRRKKKDTDSDSATSDDNSLGKKKRHSGKKDSENGFGQRSQSVAKVTSVHKEYLDEGVLSDPSAGFAGYTGRGLPRSPFDRTRSSKESLEKRLDSNGGSHEGSLRKTRKGRIKARVEAIRNLKHESSSDEESQRSTSSSILRFKSDDSLANHSKGEIQASKKTRAARTDRYIKRLSRDEEVTNDKEFETIQHILNKTNVATQRILSNPHINHFVKDEPEYCEPQRTSFMAPAKPERSFSSGHLANSTTVHSRSNLRPSYMTGSNSSVYSYPVGVISLNAKVNDEHIAYSVPYSSSVNKVRPNTNKVVYTQGSSIEHNNNIYPNTNYENDNVMVVKFPIGSVTNSAKKENIAPVPPPRDPQRKVPTPLSYMYDNCRQGPFNAEHHAYGNVKQNVDNRLSVTAPQPQNVYENNVPYRNENSLSWNKRPISSSENHIALQHNYQNIIPPNCYPKNIQPKRPSSVTAEVIRPDIYNRYMSRPMFTHLPKEQNKANVSDQQNQEYLYFTDKTPRSRKPIHITPGNNTSGFINNNNIMNRPRNASEFWKKLDSQEQKRNILPSRTLSDQALNGRIPNQSGSKFLQAQTNNITKKCQSNGDVKQNSNFNKAISLSTKAESSEFVTKQIKKDEPICYSNIDIIPMEDIRKEKKTESEQNFEDDPTKARKKSTNLDDALSELEAIYNSLGLGDEDLLDRAEKRELMTPKSTEPFPFNSPTRENYFRFPNSPNINDVNAKRINRRSSIPDKLFDDMAFRRLNPSERPKSKDVNNLVSQISYMLASPVLLEPLDNTPKSNINPENKMQEPDVIYDDVAFRNIRQANNYLKIIDPQPPFGIPLGPVSPAPYSDYLHATPENKGKNRQINQDEPDLVTDDLAYRALRKDFKNHEEENVNKFVAKNSNQPSAIFDNHVIRKKRAVRSLSANIFTMIQKEIDDALELCNNRPIEKTQSIPDLPESVMEFGRNDRAINENKSNTIDSKAGSNMNENKMELLKSEKRTKLSPPIPAQRNLSPKWDIKQSVNINKNNESTEQRNIRENYPVKVTIEKKYVSDFHPTKENNFSVDHSTIVYADRPQNFKITHETNLQSDNAIRNTSEINISSQQGNKIDVKAKCTEDSLIEISNHLNRIGDKLKMNTELSDDFEEEGRKLQALAKKCDIDLKETMHPPKLSGEGTLMKLFPVHALKNHNEIKESTKVLSVPNYKEFDNSSDDNKNALQHSNNESLDKMPSFEDLRRGINDLISGISEVSDKLNSKTKGDIITNTNKELLIGKESPILDVEREKTTGNRDSPEYNSSEELAMIFNLNDDSTTKINSESTKAASSDKHSDLNSPRLVKTINQSFIKQSSQERDKAEVGESSKESSNVVVESNYNDVPWRKHRRQSSTDNANRGVV